MASTDKKAEAEERDEGVEKLDYIQVDRVATGVVRYIRPGDRYKREMALDDPPLTNSFVRTYKWIRIGAVNELTTGEMPAVRPDSVLLTRFRDRKNFQPPPRLILMYACIIAAYGSNSIRVL